LQEILSKEHITAASNIGRKHSTVARCISFPYTQCYRKTRPKTQHFCKKFWVRNTALLQEKCRKQSAFARSRTMETWTATGRILYARSTFARTRHNTLISKPGTSMLAQKC
jgi:hypothetical protein